MSRNFELLQRAGKEDLLFGRGASDVPSNGNGRHELDLGSQAYEEAVKLVQRVFLFPNSHAPQGVVFSSVEGSGSSEICFRVGQVLASQNARSVCLVDANLSMPSLHQLAGVGKSPGLTDAIVTPGPVKDFATRIAGGNLWVVPPGSFTSEAQGSFASDRRRLRMAEFREEFSYILIDAPPISSCGDAVLLGQVADGLILVVEANSTRRETARMAKEAFEGAGVKLLGAVLNNRAIPNPQALYQKL
jgi:receptor protein-tyrosine kinase